MATYGVLLPLRLETRFIPPGMSARWPEETDPDEPGWRLRLRVIPDRASITTERLEPSRAELVALQALWDTLSKDAAFPALLPDEGELRLDAVADLDGWTDAFARLAALTGPARARQLVEAVPTTGSPPRVPESAAERVWITPTVRGLPAQLDVWVSWRGADPGAPAPQPQVIANLHPRPELLSLDPAPVNDDDALEDRWWSNWDAAVTAGLAAEIPLTRDPEEIEVLGVSGLGPGDGTTAGALFAAHGVSGDLGLLRPGAPTSTVFGSPTVDVVNADVWSGRAGSDGHAVLDLLAGPDLGLNVPVDPLLGIHEDWTERVVSACYPALWGYGLQGALGVLRDPRDPVHRPENAEWNLGLWGWASAWLRPEGGFPPIRIGRQAYGVLGVAAPSNEVVDGLTQAIGRATEPVLRTPLAVPLGRIARRWAFAAEEGLAGGGPEQALRSSIHGPVPARLRRQRLIPVVTDAIRMQANALEALEREWADRATVAHLLDQKDFGWRAHGRLYRSFGRSYPLRLPILGPGLDDGSEPADPDLMDALAESAFTAVAPIPELDVPGILRRELAPDSLLLTLSQRSVAVSSQLLWNADPTGAVDEGDALPRLGLLEPLGAPYSGTRAASQAYALAMPGEASDVHVPDFLRRAVDPAGVLDLLKHCADEPALRPIANRAVRALADAAAGRWDVWLAGLGTAHAAEAAADGGTPVLGAYGWVDTPYPDAAHRGKPGPGPGGFRLAPSEAIAGTLAVLRDRAVVDPARWNMDHDSQTVGEARRWLANLALGWHPAELLGRDIERRISESGLEPAQTRQVIADLRTQFPLRAGQGAFGCTHGLDALNGAVAPPVTAVLEPVRRMLDAAADLTLAEGVHGILTDQPARAAAAMRGLGGTERLPVPSWIDPVQPTRPVETVVLFAAPAAAPAADAGPAATAAPALDAVLRAALPAEPSWVVELAGGRRRISLEDLRCSILDLATVPADALLSMAELAAAAGDGAHTDAEPTDDDPLAEVRAWVTALRGRAADAIDVARDLPTEARAAQDLAAATRLQARLQSAVADALRLWDDITTATTEFADAEADRIADELAVIATLDPDASVSMTGTSPIAPTAVAKLARLALAAARWAFLPPRCGATLTGADVAAARSAAADLVGFLQATADRLAARIEAAIPPAPGGTALATRPGAATLAAALAELVGRPGLAIGAPLTASAPLGDAGEALDEWASAVATVRADLAAPLGVGGSAPPAGLEVFATDPSDPWRVAELAELDSLPAVGEDVHTSPAPRLTVALAPARPVAGDEREWVVLDAFTESVPTSRPRAGASFDVATPSARPPQAILVVPPSDLGAGDPTEEEIRAAVVYARMLAHGRMAVAADLEAAGVGALAAWAVLPQDIQTGAPLSSPLSTPQPDQPEVLLPDPDDADDIAAAVTADALWMLGQQWRLGEHAGEDAATPLRLDLNLSETPIAGTAANPALAAHTVPLEAGVESEPGDAPSWRPASLHYATELSAGDVTLDISEHDGGSTGWWELTSRAPLAAEPITTSQRSRPSRLVWPGAPTGRYWQIEDRRADVAGTGPDRTQPATLHLIDVIARATDDLFVAPVAATPGTIARPGAVTMTDAAGGTWPLRSPSDWNLIGIRGLDPEPAGEPDWHRAIAVLIAAGAPLEGPIVDDVAFAVDEDDNLVWAADRRAGASAVATAASGILSDTAAMTWRWSLRRSIPAGRYPFVHGFALTSPIDGADEDVFIRARLVDPEGGIADDPASPLLIDTLRLKPLALPASGVRIVRRFALARDVDGRPVVWSRRLKRPLDVPVDVDLRWDALDAEQE